jgi:hypothetical protein
MHITIEMLFKDRTKNKKRRCFENGSTNNEKN